MTWVIAIALAVLVVSKAGGLHLQMAAAGGGAGSASPPPSSPPSSPSGGYFSEYTIPENSITGAQITYDSSTWPQGDNTWDVCRAIAQEEGASIPNSNPDRLNNPGDISDYAGFGQEFHSGSYITHFPNKDTGWYYLYGKVQNIVTGNSHSYSQDSTFVDLGAEWAPPNAEAWANNVAAQLGVDPDSRVRDYIGV